MTNDDIPHLKPFEKFKMQKRKSTKLNNPKDAYDAFLVDHKGNN